MNSVGRRGSKRINFSKDEETTEKVCSRNRRKSRKELKGGIRGIGEKSKRRGRKGVGECWRGVGGGCRVSKGRTGFRRGSERDRRSLRGRKGFRLGSGVGGRVASKKLENTNRANIYEKIKKLFL